MDSKKMNSEIKSYNEKQELEDKEICNLLALIIDKELREAESKIWHAHPVWFIDGNPIVGYIPDTLEFGRFLYKKWSRLKNEIENTRQNPCYACQPTRKEGFSVPSSMVHRPSVSSRTI